MFSGQGRELWLHSAFLFPSRSLRGLIGTTFGTGLLRDSFRIALVKLRLDEDYTHVFRFAEVYQLFQVGGRRFFASFFD